MWAKHFTYALWICTGASTTVAVSSGAQQEAQTTVKVMQEQEYAVVRFVDVFKNFILLGWTAFGGPSAHIGMW
jgi:hypothetical protein